MSLQVALPVTPVDLNRHVTEHTELYRRQFVDGFAFVKYMKTMFGIDIVPLPRLSATQNLIKEGRTGTFNPTPNAVTVGARVAQVRPIKFDIKITEQEIEQAWSSYLGQMYLAAGNNIAKQEAYINQTPFAPQIVGVIVDKASEEYRMQTAFRGTYSAGVNTPATADNGLITKMNAVLGTEIPGPQIVGMVTPTDTNMVALTNALVDNITTTAPQYQDKPLQLWMSPKNKKAYERNCLSLYGFSHAQWAEQFKRHTLVDQDNIEIISEPGLTGSNRMFVTTPDNLRFLTDVGGFQLKMKDNIRDWDLAADFRATVDFCDGSLIWTNTLA